MIQRVAGETQFGLTRHLLVYHAPGTPLIIAGDAQHLEQVLQNLSQNTVRLPLMV